jgi:transcriptional regulator with XRE-family HTH domain
MNNLGSYIKYARKLKKMTQKDLAKKMDLCPSAVSLWEKGEGAPTRQNLLFLTGVIDVNYLVLSKYYIEYKQQNKLKKQNAQYFQAKKPEAEEDGIVIEMKNLLPYEPIQPDVVQSEPVAWVDRIFIERPDLAAKLEYDDIFSRTEVNNQIPLYTTPQNREWVNLTIEEVKEIKDKLKGMKDVFFDTDILGVIQDKLREKNNG